MQPAPLRFEECAPGVDLESEHENGAEHALMRREAAPGTVELGIVRIVHDADRGECGHDDQRDNRQE